MQYTHKHQTDFFCKRLLYFDYILKQTQVGGATMVFARFLGRVFGCLKRKRKNLRDSLQSRDRDVAANETLSESDSLSVDSVYLIDSAVSGMSEDSQSVGFDDDCWSYSESVELVRYRIILLLSRLTHLYYNNLLIRLYVLTLLLLSLFFRF